MSAFLVLVLLCGTFLFDIETLKSWAQGSGCGGPDANENMEFVSSRP